MDSPVLLDTTDDVVRMLVQTWAGNIRDLEVPGTKPYQYSSGWFGPGYLLVKKLVGFKPFVKSLAFTLAHKLLAKGGYVDFVAGNATGGMIPGWLLSEYLQELSGRAVRYVYVRNTRKLGGTEEYIVGHQENPHIQEGMSALVVEELTNMTTTTCNSATVLRCEGFLVDH